MLFSLLNQYRNGSAELEDLIIGALFSVIVILLALCVHEAVHGYAAYKLGDPTARNLGRLTLDPTKHLDPFGALCMLLFGYGWAKPVPVNSRYFKKPRRDMAITAFAGPLSNLALAFVSTLFCMVLQRAWYNYLLKGESEFVFNLLYFAWLFFTYMHLLNIRLAIFNLIPIPPLDGSRILFLFLPDKYYFGLMKYERYISLLFIALLYMGVLSKPLDLVSQLISNGMFGVLSFIPGL